MYSELEIHIFMKESLRIEGITRNPSKEEIDATIKFLDLSEITLVDVNELQAVYAPGMPLRDQYGLNVRVGKYLPPLGSPEIPEILEGMLQLIQNGEVFPFEAHIGFEMLHPYCDGNGRVGRTLWAWHMLKVNKNPFALPFLHQFYYDTLATAEGV